jgi:hypothetical protein
MVLVLSGDSGNCVRYVNTTTAETKKAEKIKGIMRDRLTLTAGFRPNPAGCFFRPHPVPPPKLLIPIWSQR